MDSFTPQQTVELLARLGAKKSHMRLDKLFFNSFAAGPLLGFGCAVLLSVNASPWYQENAPGLIRMIGALLFPVGLILITLTGADLWTTNVMFMTTAYLSKRVTLKDVSISLVVSFFGNLAGSLFIMAIVFGYGGVFTAEPVYREAVITFVHDKAVLPQWHQIFLRAIGANMLVCLAVWMAIQGRQLVDKIFAIYLPTATFVALALDHVVANMFFIPLGIFLGADFGVGYYIWKSMIPTALGNFVGGGLFVGTLYWYLYLSDESNVKVSFDLGAEGTAIGGAGPLASSGGGAREHGDANGVINGMDPSKSQSPPSRHLISNVGSELHDDSPYAKTWMEREKDEKSEKPASDSMEKSSDSNV